MNIIRIYPGISTILVTLTLLAFVPCRSQILPDRIVVLNPLADTSAGRQGFIPLPGTRLYGEFARYSNGSGSNHRWNAKTGGYSEIARWDSTFSIAMAGTMEVVMDPQNDIGFNPRAIFWEEAFLFSLRAPWGYDQTIQFGYTHRCKHDIDNHEVFLDRGEDARRTLIYGGPFLRLLHEPEERLLGIRLRYAGRFDYFIHTLDDWDRAVRDSAFRSFEDLTAAAGVTVRLDLPFGSSGIAAHLLSNGQLGLYDDAEPQAGIPLVELGIDFTRENGSAYTFFVRGEHQPDAGISRVPTPGKLFLFGVRTTSWNGMW